MGFFTRFEKVDDVVTRGYARWGKWVWGAIIAPFIIYGAYIVWAAFWGPPTGPVTLIIHNELDRPILGFSVNGVAGANAFVRDKNNPYASDGGKSTCCGSITGNKAEVSWTLSTTRAQYDSGLRKETRHTIIPMPQRKWGENYLHVYFLPDNDVRLWWGTGFIHPEAEELPASTEQNKIKE